MTKRVSGNGGGICPVCLQVTRARNAEVSHFRKHVREGVLREREETGILSWQPASASPDAPHFGAFSHSIKPSSLGMFTTPRQAQMRFWSVRHVPFAAIPGLLEAVIPKTEE